MTVEAIDMLEEEEEALKRPSSWSAALSQLPGFPSTGPAIVPAPSPSSARAVTSAVAEDLAGEDDEAL